jgi:hypothetical protein
MCATRQTDGRTGTNLLSASEAEAMLRHVLQLCAKCGQPKEPSRPNSIKCRACDHGPAPAAPSPESGHGIPCQGDIELVYCADCMELKDCPVFINVAGLCGWVCADCAAARVQKVDKSPKVVIEMESTKRLQTIEKVIRKLPMNPTKPDLQYCLSQIGWIVERGVEGSGYHEAPRPENELEKPINVLNRNPASPNPFLRDALLDQTVLDDLSAAISRAKEQHNSAAHCPACGSGQRNIRWVASNTPVCNDPWHVALQATTSRPESKQDTTTSPQTGQLAADEEFYRSLNDIEKQWFQGGGRRFGAGYNLHSNPYCQPGNDPILARANECWLRGYKYEKAKAFAACYGHTTDTTKAKNEREDWPGV